MKSTQIILFLRAVILFRITHTSTFTPPLNLQRERAERSQMANAVLPTEVEEGKKTNIFFPPPFWTCCLKIDICLQQQRDACQRVIPRRCHTSAAASVLTTKKKQKKNFICIHRMTAVAPRGTVWSTAHQKQLPPRIQRARLIRRGSVQGKHPRRVGEAGA